MVIIGLICEGQYSIRLTGELINRHIGKEMADRFRPRDKQGIGWPGNVIIQKSDGKQLRVDSAERRRLNEYYINYRCMQCYDMNNIYADIVCGDPYYLEGMLDSRELKKGVSVCITRTKTGEKIVCDAKEARFIFLERTEARDFLAYNIEQSKRENRMMSTVYASKKLELPYLYEPNESAGASKNDIRQIKYLFKLNLANTESKAKKLVFIRKRSRLFAIKNLYKRVRTAFGRLYRSLRGVRVDD